LSSDGATGERFFWHRIRAEYVLRALVASGFQPGHTVLDIGAGAGVFGRHFARRFPGGQYAFVEPVEALAAHLRACYGETADWTSRSYREANAVILLDVIEHVEDDRAFLASIAAGVRRGTTLVVTCPALPVLWSHWDTKLGHHRRYTAASLRAALFGAGMVVSDVRYLFQTMVLLGLWRKARPARTPDFPRLSPALNSALYLLGRIERGTLGWVPFGASVAATGAVP
jgi:2-polyprenyl-3-methyl-5-hydroxy-6-metoxy-1,4-benzoquinol methylase